MKKVLPININPYIRTFSYHGFHHAVISTADKVNLHMGDEAACIQVKNFNQYTWQTECKDLKYQVDSDNILRFFSNKWNVNMNVVFWRECDVYDAIDVIVYNQLHSNVWATIALFLTSDEKNNTNDNPDDPFIEAEVGNFSKDGLYYRITSLPHVKILPEPLMPLRMSIIKTAENILIRYSENNQDTKEIVIVDNVSDYVINRIGFRVTLGCNSYYEWLFSNYINIYFNPSNQYLPFDYLCNLHKNWDLHTNDYFIDYFSENENAISTLGFSLIDYIKKMIDLGRYVETLMNDNIHFRVGDENGPFFHQNLIYGYDDPAEELYTLYYKKGKICPGKMKYSDFTSPRNHIPNRKICIYKYNPGYERYTLDTRHILQLFQEYINSQNISYYEPQYDNSYSFGIGALQKLLSYEKEILISDRRISYLIYEHCVCNRDRAEYLYCKNLLNYEQFDYLYQIAKEECDLASIMIALALKQNMQENRDLHKLKKYLNEIIDLETKYTVKIISCLKQSLEDNKQ